MLRSRPARAIVLLALGLAAAQVNAGLSEAEQAGRRLFEQGIGASGESPQAQVGGGGLTLPASTLPCANCHGPDGRGRPEGGVTPPDIRWSELVKPYGHVHENRRRHGPFDAGSFRIAVTEGLDPAGNRLDPAMPRYLLSARDLEHLQAYLAHLQARAAPGVTDDAVRIGTLLPLRGPLAAAGKSVRALLEAQFETVNAAGGVFGRRLELAVAEYLGDDARSLANLERLLDDDHGVFALISPFAAGFEQQLTDLAKAHQVPVVAPVVIERDKRPAANTHVFHLLSGGAELASVLAGYCTDPLGLAGAEIGLLRPAGPAGDIALAQVRHHLAAQGVEGTAEAVFRPGLSTPDAVVASLREQGVKAVVLLGGGLDPLAIAQAADRLGWYPELLVPGPFASQGIMALPAGFASKVFVAYPSLPGDRSRPAWADFAGLMSRAGIDGGPQPTLVAGYAGVKLLVEGLKRAGRELSQETMLTSLETVQDFQSGLLPPLSYNTTRRIGALGGYVVSVDLERHVYRPIGAWRRLD
ncbi:MAG: ABC transporter substrate-binding protein [Rhodocyclaceae bacterium]|nr:ABC transporter substrate-binding protein [Rhodocyclaceae bacterium]